MCVSVCMLRCVCVWYALVNDAIKLLMREMFRGCCFLYTENRLYRNGLDGIKIVIWQLNQGDENYEAEKEKQRE